MGPVKSDVICFTFYILGQQNTKLLKSNCRILHWKNKPETLLSIKPLRFRKTYNESISVSPLLIKLLIFFLIAQPFDQTDKTQLAKPPLRPISHRNTSKHSITGKHFPPQLLLPPTKFHKPPQLMKLESLWTLAECAKILSVLPALTTLDFKGRNRRMGEQKRKRKQPAFLLVQDKNFCCTGSQYPCFSCGPFHTVREYFQASRHQRYYTFFPPFCSAA